MKKFSKEIQIALVAVVGIVVLYAGLQFLKGRTIFSSDRNYYVKFKDISGLSASSPIYTNGYRVGVVESIIYDYDHQDQIVAVIGLNNQMRLPKGSTAEIASDLLGNIKLELKLGPNPADILSPGDTISGGLQQGTMSQVGEMIPQIQAMLPKLDSILMNVNLLLSVNDLNLAATMAKVNNTLENVEQMTAKLNSNEGTLGLLMRDPELYNNLNATMMHADSLMIDLKSHPKRYVHFSVFGRKDK